MLGLYFLFSLVGLGIVLRWYVLNDGKDEEHTTGLFRLARGPVKPHPIASGLAKSGTIETPGDPRNSI